MNEMTAKQAVMVVSEALNYEVLIPLGEVGDRMENGQRVVDPLPGGEVGFKPLRVAYETVMARHGVLAPDSNRADDGPLPGRYVGHPWAVEVAVQVEIDVAVESLLGDLPETVVVGYGHHGEGDWTPIGSLPFEGWERVEKAISEAPHAPATRALVGADFARAMDAAEAADREAAYRGVLYWDVRDHDGSQPEREATIAERRRRAALVREDPLAHGYALPYCDFTWCAIWASTRARKAA
jgi:hypothetical protein